jgi:hypothetical protein
MTPPRFRTQLRAGNALGDVLEREEPFDAIHVGAGTPAACLLHVDTKAAYFC